MEVLRTRSSSWALLCVVSVGLPSSTIATDTVEDVSAVPLSLPAAMVAAAHMWLEVGLVVFLGFLMVVYTQPQWLMDFVVRHSHTSVLWCVRTSSHVCSLTIDDAPSAATPQILDLLREHGVKATFFIISNNIQGNEEILKRIVREGHRLGNHLTEDRASILDELHVFEQKLKECDAAIARFQPPPSDDGVSLPALEPLVAQTSDIHEAKTTETTERTRLMASDATSDASGATKTYGTITSSKWLRPASGWFTSNMREIVMSHGYKICMGSVYPHDAQIKSERLNSLHLRLRTRPGAVLIVHDRAWTVGVLRDALPVLVRKFKFVSLDELYLHHDANKVKSLT